MRPAIYRFPGRYGRPMNLPAPPYLPVLVFKLEARASIGVWMRNGPPARCDALVNKTRVIDEVAATLRHFLHAP